MQNLEHIEKLEKRLVRAKLARQQAEDLLEQKAAALFEKNRELQSLSEGLEKLVAQRTAQMQKARDEALSALQVKSDFIANMSHELRTPMNGVLGIIGLLQEENVTAGQRELLDIAKASGEHLLLVINDVLDFSKIEADKIDLVMAPVNIKQYIKGICKPFELQATQKGIGFEYHVDDDVPSSLITDKLRLTQIITNLLSNAVKFTKKGLVSLHFGYVGASADNNFRLTVADSGIGISPENAKSVFSAFEQADTSITREFGGTGLGMNITKRLVELFNGNIQLESKLGEGTRFFVDLQFDVGDNLTTLSVEQLSANTIEADALVLLVEDNKINQLVAKRLLENWGLAVHIAENGQEAIERLQKESYDMVLMDLQMPIKGGIEATLDIRKQELIDANIPIIAMTAHSSQEHIDECFAAGMQGHVSKPIDKQILKDIIGQYLRPVLRVDTDADTHDHARLVVDGVDIQDGLSRLNGDWTLLHNLITSFIDEFAGLGDVISSSQDKHDLAETSAILHRVKGSGGNLGLTDLAALAAQGEAKLKAENTLSLCEITAIQKQVDRIAASFASVEDPSKDKHVSNMRVESPEYLRHKMNEILDNLSKDVLASEEAIKDLLMCDMGNSIAQHIQNANLAMQKFDFERVEDMIKQAQENLNNT